MSFAGLLNQTVTIYNRTANPNGFDRYGNAVFVTGTDYPARFQKTTKEVMKSTGEVVDITGTVFIRGDVTVANDDKLVYSGNNFKVVSVNESVLGNGAVHHVTLQVGDWQL